MQCKAAPHPIVFACALMFDDNNTIIIRHKFCIMPPPLLRRNVKTTSQNSNCWVLTKSSGQTGLKIRIYTSLLSFSTSGSRLQHVVKTGTNEGGTRIANIGAGLRNISLLSVKTSHLIS